MLSHFSTLASVGWQTIVCHPIIRQIAHQNVMTWGRGLLSYPCIDGQRHLRHMQAYWPLSALAHWPWNAQRSTFYYWHKLRSRVKRITLAQCDGWRLESQILCTAQTRFTNLTTCRTHQRFLTVPLVLFFHSKRRSATIGEPNEDFPCAEDVCVQAFAGQNGDICNAPGAYTGDPTFLTGHNVCR